MEKLLITEEIANHELNNGLDLVVGSELELNSMACDDTECESRQPPKGENGHYRCVLGNCVFVPAPM